jgi:hypothetical protein
MAVKRTEILYFASEASSDEMEEDFLSAMLEQMFDVGGLNSV